MLPNIKPESIEDFVKRCDICGEHPKIGHVCAKKCCYHPDHKIPFTYIGEGIHSCNDHLRKSLCQICGCNYTIGFTAICMNCARNFVESKK